MLSVLPTYIDTHSHTHTNNNQDRKEVGGNFGRGWRWFFGLDSGDGFTSIPIPKLMELYKLHMYSFDTSITPQ